MPTLFPHQLPAAERTLDLLRSGRRPIVCLPTGGGKSVVAVYIADRWQAEHPGSRVLFLAHRHELVTQLASHLERAGMRVGIVKAGFPRVPELSVQVASVQTLSRRDLFPANLLIWDECHHILAKSFRRISDAYSDASQMGLTATPYRLDGRGLGDVFSDIVATDETKPDVLCRTNNPLTGIPYLIEPRVYAPPSASLDGVHRRAGDYVNRELAELVDKPKLIADVVATWQRYAAGVPTICFAVNVAHSQHIVEQFVASGIIAEHCDGETPPDQRAAILGRLAGGKTQIVSNVGLFGEGFDLPSIKCVILARPTESMAMYYQMVGRAMRPTVDGGPAIVLDHAGLVHKFGRVTQRLEYSLDGAPEATGTKSEGHGLKTCPNCFRMVLRSRPTCPECGHSLVSEIDIPEFEPGELVPMGDAPAAPPRPPRQPASPPPPPDARDEAWRYIEEARIEQGREPGWAVAEFRRQFDESPSITTVGGVRVLVTAGASESTRDMAWEHFKKQAMAKGKIGRYVYAEAASRCAKMFGSVPASAKQRAKENRKQKDKVA